MVRLFMQERSSYSGLTSTHCYLVSVTDGGLLCNRWRSTLPEGWRPGLCEGWRSGL